MNDTEAFGWIIAVVGVVGLAAVLSNRLTERLKLPAPVLVLIAAAVSVAAVPSLHAPSESTVERLVTVALLFILFDGGMHIGWQRFRSAAAPIATVGLLGTVLTVVGGSLLIHLAFGIDWYPSILVATAVAPTDPAVVFSVLGRREVAGRSGTILEGESGANDPVGIALMASLIAAGGLSAGAWGEVAGQFALQMAVGAAFGVSGGAALLWFMRRVPLPSEGLYPIRTMAGALLLFGAATVASGSGFLAVFLAGIVLGDGRAPYKREIERFHSALGSMAEIAAFVALGLTVDLAELARPDVWVPGLVLGAALALVIRPVLVGLCLAPIRLQRNERAFVLLAGLKGAVPILLGSFLLAARLPDAERLYGIVIVVVVFSVAVQGSLVPTAARLLRLPMRTVDPEPWALGVRLRDEPSGVHRLTIAPDAPADGTTIEKLTQLPGDSWISFVVRDQRLVSVRGETMLHAGDEVLILADPELYPALSAAFEQPAHGDTQYP